VEGPDQFAAYQFTANPDMQLGCWDGWVSKQGAECCCACDVVFGLVVALHIELFWNGEGLIGFSILMALDMDEAK